MIIPNELLNNIPAMVAITVIFVGLVTLTLILQAKYNKKNKEKRNDIHSKI